MPPKAKANARAAPPPPPSSSSSEEDMGGGGMFDLTKFTNANYSREFMATLTPDVRERTEVLLTYDADMLQLQRRSAVQRDQLRREFEKQCAALLSRRRELVLGAQPTDAEVSSGIPPDHADVDVAPPAPEDAAVAEPVAKFWLEALQHHIVVDELITERDALVLESLTDITAETLDPTAGPRGFTVTFHFAPNAYLESPSLSKTLYVKDDGELDRTTETAPQWKGDANPTVTVVTKKLKSKRGPAKIVKEEEPCPSFFTLFSKSDDVDELEQQFALLNTIRDKVIPLAVEYFTGEAPDGSSDIEDYSDEEEEDGESDEEEDDEPPPPPPKRSGGKGQQQPKAQQQQQQAKGAAAPPKAPQGRGRGGAKQPPQCEQQ